MLKKLAYIVFTILILLTILNIFSGLVLWRMHKNYQPKKGHIDAPYVYFQQEPEGPYKNGFQIDSSISLTKDSNEYRVLLLGGSVANAIGNMSIQNGQILLGQQTNNYVQSALQQAFPAKKITVLNGSIAAFVTEQEFIAFQKFLQFYNPDLVIGLHGYNDMESFRVTHKDQNDQFAPLPMYYVSGTVSPPFKMVENFKKNYSFGNIFKGYYSHLENAGFFALRKVGLINYTFENTDDINDERLKVYAKKHFYVCKDLYDFCKIKSIRYLNFLQPVRFYKPKDSTYHGQNKNSIYPYLSKLYYYMEEELDLLPNHKSLTHIPASALNYVDDCHPNEAGYKTLTDSLLPYIRKEMNDDLSNVKNN